jgi:hypothetical protein
VAPLWVVSDVSCTLYNVHYEHTLTQTLSSCLAHPTSLDTPCRHRSAAHTDVLLGMYDEETLRKTYGIAPGATVCTPSHPNVSMLRFVSPTRRTSPERIYTRRPHPIYYIKLSRVYSKITLSTGWANILSFCTVLRVEPARLTRSIAGE